jgi:hypothetical protein
VASAIYSASIDLSGAYKVDQEAITQMTLIARKFLDGEEVKLSMSLEDSQSVSTADAADLFNDFLIQSRSIENLSIAGSNYKAAHPTSISITLTRTFDPVRIRVSGDRDRCTIVRGEILEVMASRKQWYAFLYSGFFGWSIPLSIGGFLGPSFGGVIDEKTISPFGFKLSFLIASIFVAAYWIRRLLFPKLQFDFGRSGRHVSAVEKWRSFIFIVVMVGLIVGVVASLIATRMSTP